MLAAIKRWRVMMTKEAKRMTDDEILAVLEETQAIRRGHFRLTSGRHSDTYIQCARVLEHPRLSLTLAAETVARLPEDIQQAVDLVVSPAVGGILFGFAVAAALDKRIIFTERENAVMVLRRSFEIPPGAKVLIAEDVVTTGGSVKEVESLVLASGGEVLGVVSLIDRGGAPVFAAPFYPLLHLKTPSWEPETCFLCEKGLEIYAPGSRNLAKHPV